MGVSVQGVDGSRYGRYVGRVGALAVALGVGAAVATGQGLGLGSAWADESGAGEGSAADSQASESSDPSTGAGEPAASAGSDGAGAGAGAGAQDSGGDPSDAGMNIGASGGVDSSVNDEGQSTDGQAGSDGDDPVVDDDSDDVDVDVDVDTAVPPVVVGGQGGSGSPAPQTDSGSGSDSGVPGQGGTAADVSDTSDESTTTTTLNGVPSLSRSRVARAGESSSLSTFGTMGEESGVTALAQPSLTAQASALSVPSAVVGLASTFVAALLSPFLSPGPAAPAQPPLLWAVLGWVRREVTRTFFNKTPVAVADPVTTSEDTPKVIDVLANDTDDDALSVTSFTQPANGTVVKNADGTFTYTPKANWSGTDTFTYTVSDAESPFHLHGLLSIFTGQKHTATGTVTVTVAGVNDAPVADNDAYTVEEDHGLLVSAADGLLNGDTDIDNTTGQLKVIIETDAAHGYLRMNDDGSFAYGPDDDFYGTDTFTYRVTDGTTTSNLATVTITVTPVADAPIAFDDEYTVDEDTVLTVPAPGVLDNDYDGDGDTLTAVVVTQPTKGTLAFNADGSFTYTPNANVNGTDSFTYQVNDSSLEGTTTTVNITINPVNDAPVVQDDDFTVAEDGTLARNMFANDSDPDGDTFLFDNVVFTTEPNGSFAFDAEGNFTYTPDPGFSGVATFTYTVRDIDGAVSNTATVNITVTTVDDGPPVANPDGATVAEGGSTTINVLGNDTDPDGNPTINPASVVVIQPVHGTATVNADGTINYVSNGDEVTTDSFTYTVKDSSGATSNTATVTVTITPVNDSAPVANNDSYSVNEDQTLTVTAPGLLGNDTDGDGDPLTAVVVSQPTKGTLNFNSDGSFLYTPNENVNGTDSFTYQVTDGTNPSSTTTVNITINPVADPPTAPDASYTINEGGTLTHPFGGGDVDGDPVIRDIYAAPTHGTLTRDGDTFTYTPHADFFGTDEFGYIVQNADGSDFAVGSVRITVNPVNDPPVSVNDSYTVNEDAPLTVGGSGVLANDTDVDSGGLTAALVSGPATGTLNLNSNGSFTYTPHPDFFGTDSFTYKASDGTTTGNTTTVSITVNPMPDAPVANPDVFTALEDTPLIITIAMLTANDSDPDGDPLSFAGGDSTAVNHSLSFVGGNLIYEPNPNSTGSGTFGYTISDGNGNFSNSTVTVNVTPVNDAPVATNNFYLTGEDRTLTVGAASGVLANDTDVDSTDLTAVLVSNPSHGSVTLNPDGSFNYTPAADYNGSDEFTYKTTDGAATSAAATVIITITTEPDNVRAVDDTFTTPEDTPITITVAQLTANDADPDEFDTVAFNGAFGTGVNGTWSQVGNSITFTPNANFHGTASFKYSIKGSDSSVDDATVSITVTPVNDAPETGFVPRILPGPNSVFRGTLANYAGDVDGDSLTFVLVSYEPQYGLLVINPDGSYVWERTDLTGMTSFRWSVTDGKSAPVEGFMEVYAF